MKNIFLLLFTTVSFAFADLSVLPVPPGATRAFEAQGKGVQIYTCTAKGDSFSWQLKAPEADLLDSKGAKLGTHYVGPTWKLKDGSLITGELITKMDSPTPGSVPQLLLRAKTHEGKGKLAAVTYITRTQTQGGIAPASGCDSGHAAQESRIPYSATYTFYQ